MKQVVEKTTFCKFLSIILLKRKKEKTNDIEHLHITEEDENYKGSIFIDPTFF